MKKWTISARLKTIYVVCSTLILIAFFIYKRTFNITFLFLLGFVDLIVLSLSLQKKQNQTKSNSFLDKKFSQSIRGIMALVIVFSHLHYYINDMGILSIFKPFGYLGVSVFFFYSGYGVVCSSIKNKNYLQAYWTKRLTKLYVPYLIATLIYVLVSVAVNTFTVPDNWWDILLWVTAIKGILPFSWYVIVVLGWYIIFYLVSLLKLSKIKTIIILVAIIGLYYILGYFSGIDSYYYKSSVCLLIGSMFGYYQPFMKKTIGKNKLFQILVVLFFLASVVIMKMFYSTSDIMQIVIIFFSSLTFVLALYVVGEYFIIDSRITRYLGSISYEIYLLQGVAYVICKQFFFNNTILFMTIFWIIMIPVSFGVHIIGKKLINLFLKSRKEAF